MDEHWHTAGELILGVIVTFETWLVRKVWNSKPDRDETNDIVNRAIMQLELRVEKQASERLTGIKDEIQDMRDEATRRFDTIGRDMGDIGRRVDRVLELLAEPRGR